MSLTRAPRSAYVSEREFFIWHLRATNPKLSVVEDNARFVIDIKPIFHVITASYDDFATEANVSIIGNSDFITINYRRVPLWYVWYEFMALFPVKLSAGLSDAELETQYRNECTAAEVNFDRVIPSIDFATTPITFKRAADGKTLTCTYTGLSDFNEVYSHDKDSKYQHTVPLIESE